MTAMKVRKRPAAKLPAETMTNDETRVLDDGTWPVGSVAHQGDLIFVRIAELPVGATPRANRQLADGTTQGSRHVCEKGDVFDAPAESVVAAVKSVCPRSDVQVQYVGPLFRTKRGVAFIDHPEHGAYRMNGKMVVAVIVQRNLDAEERERRTVD